MNKYTHLSDLERKKAMLPVLTEDLTLGDNNDSSFNFGIFN